MARPSADDEAVVAARRDGRAALGVGRETGRERHEHAQLAGDYLDAIYRGYCTLGAELHVEDRALQAAIAESIIDQWCLTRGPVDLPLAIGCHPDHRLVPEIGARLASEGALVTYYEDFPYVTVAASSSVGWRGCHRWSPS